MLHSHGLLMALIEIDGLPNLKMGGSFHGYVTNNQRLITIMGMNMISRTHLVTLVKKNG